MKELKIEIEKTDDNVNIDYTDGADVHEMIGLLATVMNHLTLQAQGFDIGNLIKQIHTKSKASEEFELYRKFDVDDLLNTMLDDFAKVVKENIEYMVETHLDAWKSHYYRKSLKEIQTELYKNHDLSIEVDFIENLLGRNLSDTENNVLTNYFNESVLNEFR